MKENDKKQTRAPKQIGDFGEGLVNYVLIKKGHEIACVDHVGADLISEKNGKRYAISVKTRFFKAGSTESKMTIIPKNDLTKLKTFADQFNFECLFAQVICYSDINKIYVFIFKTENISEILPKKKSGYSLNFGKRNIENLKRNENIDFSCLENELIGEKDW